MSGRTGGARISADTEALRSRLRIDEYERLLRAERDRFGRWDLASRTERRVAALLEPTHLWGWQLLPDRRRPRSRTANVDMIHIGPGGVLVIDVKAWREPRVEGATSTTATRSRTTPWTAFWPSRPWSRKSRVHSVSHPCRSCR